MSLTAGFSFIYGVGDVITVDRRGIGIFKTRYL